MKLRSFATVCAFTNRLAGRILELAESAANNLVPEPVAERSKDMMINAAAVGLAGAAQPEALAVTRFVREMGGNGKSTIIGMGLRSSPVNACLANGLMVRLLEFDDEIAGRNCHPTAAIFPAVMAVAESERCSGRQALAAFALGCEITSKLGRLISSAHPEVSPAVHPEPVAGRIGAAAAAGIILGLDADEMVTALEISGETASPIWAGLSQPAPALKYGRTAARGVTAALLSQEGMPTPNPSTSPAGLPEWFPASMTEARLEEFFESLGNPWDVISPGVALRLYPCPLAGHSPIDAMLQLLQQHRIGAEQAEEIGVSVSPEALQALPFHDPQTPLEARRSLTYLAAVTLLQGQPLLEQFHPENLFDPRVRQVMERVRLRSAEVPTVLSPQPATVTIKVTGGRQLQQRVDYARGGPAFPLEPEELDAKFLYCARHIMTPDHIQGAIEQFRDIENIQDVSGLASILGA